MPLSSALVHLHINIFKVRCSSLGRDSLGASPLGHQLCLFPSPVPHPLALIYPKESLPHNYLYTNCHWDFLLIEPLGLCGPGLHSAWILTLGSSPQVFLQELGYECIY